jgi:hypothetical protein
MRPARCYALGVVREGRAGAIGGVVVAVAFAMSRIVYFRAGIRFDASPIDYFAQLIDRALLRDRLAESLLYLHAQPPFYNLLVGVALKLAPEHPEWVLWPLFMGAGLYAALCFYVMLIYLRLSVPLAAFAGACICASPLFVIYENWCFYPALDVAWIAGAGAWLARSRARPGAALAIAGLHLGGLCLTRSLFHPVFFVLAAMLVLAFAQLGTRHRVLACLAPPAILLFALCAKNLTLFGFFGTSSWSSRNVWRAVTCVLGPKRVNAERAELSPAAKLSAFEPGDRNVSAFRLAPRHTGVPALDAVSKSNPAIPAVNYNHWSIPASAHFYAEDAVHLVLAYPRAYVRRTLKLSVPLFFERMDQGFTDANHARIQRAADAFDDFEHDFRTHLAAALGLLFAFGTLLARGVPRRVRLLLAFGWLVLSWVTVVGILGEWGENYRFRYNIAWLAWVISFGGYAACARWVGVAAWRWRVRLLDRAAGP